MKPRLAVALLVAGLVVPALAQVRGVPASITSYSPTRSFVPGVPASITSVGPFGFGGPCTTPGALVPSALGCLDPQFSDPRFGLGLNSFSRPIHVRRRHGGGFVPVYVPYAYPVPVEQPVVIDEQGDEEGLEPPAPTIFERRSRTGVPVTALAPRPDPRPDAAAPAADPAPPAPAPDAPGVVLIFRDGHEREVKNYAIIGNTLYDLGTFIALKIPLVNLNLKATVKANEDRGVDFTLPASIKLE